MLARFMVERALILTAEITETSLLDVTFRIWDIQVSLAYPSIKRRVFFSWESPLLSFLKVNFDDSVTDRRGRAEFVIYGLDSRFITVSGVRLVETFVFGVELRAAWDCICCYTSLILQANRLIVEEDSAMVMAWLQGRPIYDMVTHLLVCNIHHLLLECITFDIKYIYYELNSVADQIVSFIAHHFDNFFNDVFFLSMSFRNIFFLIFQIIFIVDEYKISFL